jgi:hypothetical protein
LISDLAAGTAYVLRINNITDLAGNPISPNTESVITLSDYLPPQLLSAEGISSTEVVACFSERLDEPTAINVANYEVYDTENQSRTITVVSASLLPTGTSVRLSVAEPLESNRSYTLRVSNVSDIAGNVIQAGSSASFIHRSVLWGNIGLYADAAHSTRCVSGEGFYEFDLWVWCRPSDRGQICAEFRVLYPANVIQSTVTPNASLISVMLGDLAGGMSVCYNECQWDWNWPFRQSMYCTDPTQTIIEIWAHPDVGVWQFANCDEGFPTESCDAYPSLLLNVLPEDCPEDYPFDVVPPVIVEASIISELLVDVVFSEPVDSTSAEEASNYTLHELNNQSNVIQINAADLLDDRSTVRLELGNPVSTETSYMLTVINIEDLSGNPILAGSVIRIYEQVPPELVSVEIVSLQNIKVSFNEPMNEADVESIGNYSCHVAGNPLSTVGISDAHADSSGLMVDLSFSSNLQEGQSYTLHVHDVADIAGNLIAPGSEINFFISDERPPTISRAAVISSREVEVFFNEQVDAITATDSSNYELFEQFGAMQQVSIIAVTQLDNGRVVRLTAAESLVVHEQYLLRVSNIQDLSGNIIAPESEYLLIDITAPILLSVTRIGQFTIDAIFNEPLDQTAANFRSNYLLFETFAVNRVIDITDVELLLDCRTVRLTFDSFPRNNVSHTLRVDNMKDVSGNTIISRLMFSFIPHDTYPPELVSGRVTSSSTIEVIFNEPLNEAAAMNALNYEMFLSSDPTITHEISYVHLSNWRVIIKLAENILQGCDYTVRVNNISDLAGNDILSDSEVYFSYSADHLIGLYIDSAHEENEVFFSQSPTQFTFYVWCLPGLAGVICEEFAISYPSNVLPGPVTENDAIISVQLGDLVDGVSCCFTGCLMNWGWTYSQTCFITDQSQTVLEIIAHPDVEVVQVANCEEGYPIDPAAIMSSIFINPSHATVATYLQSYTAEFDGNNIEVKWSLSEIDEGVEFHVLRGDGISGDYYELSSQDIIRSGLDFAFRDSGFQHGGTYRYRVEYSDGGNRQLLFESDPVEVPALQLTLNQNYPNPFNPSTTIRYYLPSKCRVTLDIFDINGKLVTRLVDAVQQMDAYAVQWEGRDGSGIAVASGVYFYRLTAGKERISRKMVLLR